MLFSGKIRFHDVERLTARCVLFATICHYSPLFTTIRDYSYSSRLFAVRYSRLFAIRYSGFPDTRSCDIPLIVVNSPYQNHSSRAYSKWMDLTGFQDVFRFQHCIVMTKINRTRRDKSELEIENQFIETEGRKFTCLDQIVIMLIL